MPFKSKAQQRKFFAMANRGEISKAKAKEWADETPNIKALPERKKQKKHASPEAPMVDKKALRDVANLLHGISNKPAVVGAKKAKKPKAKLNKGRAPKGSTMRKSSSETLVNAFVQEILKLSQVKSSAPLPHPPPPKKDMGNDTVKSDTRFPFLKEQDRKKKDVEMSKKSAELLARAFVHKLAALSSEDVANALANQSSEQEITPEDIEAFAQQHGKEYGRTGGIAGGVLGALGGAALGGVIAAPRNRLGLGLLAGGLLGGGLLGGLGYLSSKKRGVDWGRHLGEVAQAGSLPSRLPYPAENYTSYATGEYPDQSAPLSPEEFDALKQQMAREAMIEGGLSGIGSGALSSVYASPEESDMSSVMRPIAAGATEASIARADALDRARQLQDLYRRGYVDLANRVREEA